MTNFMLMDDIALGLLNWVLALSLAAARILACAVFIPVLGNRYMSALQRNVICLALSLPQAWFVWWQMNEKSFSGVELAVLGVKEALMGAMLGFLIAMPFMVFQGACTLIDNQRGANAAQNVNPSLQADASILGELAERVLIVYLIGVGVFPLIFDVIAKSYAIWPVLSGFPAWTVGVKEGIFEAFMGMLSTMLVYASPVLLLLLCIEFGMAIASTSVQGLDIYQTAMPIKSICALVVIVFYFPALLNFASSGIEGWWVTEIFGLFNRHE